MFYGYGGESFEVLPTMLMIYSFIMLVKASIDWHLFGQEKTVKRMVKLLPFFTTLTIAKTVPTFVNSFKLIIAVIKTLTAWILFNAKADVDKDIPHILKDSTGLGLFAVLCLSILGVYILSPLYVEIDKTEVFKVTLRNIIAVSRPSSLPGKDVVKFLKITTRVHIGSYLLIGFLIAVCTPMETNQEV